MNNKDRDLQIYVHIELKRKKARITAKRTRSKIMNQLHDISKIKGVKSVTIGKYPIDEDTFIDDYIDEMEDDYD